jgi:DNA repair ATPase RecN
MSGTGHEVDSAELWGRLGLAELRRALIQTEQLMARFEQTLHALPPCTKCAHSQLLQRLETETAQLGRDMTSLSVLAESIRQALQAVEQADASLRRSAPSPCRCTSGSCTCHDD